MPSFQATVRARSSVGALGGDAERVLPAAMRASLVELLGGMDQRLGRNAADIEAGAAGLRRLDDDGVDAELAGAGWRQT